ncbi:MAG TPA: DUF3185 domain-containing protein [Candidatus Polarisedimenticolia bacterium]|jgi:uncharacterized membrane protein YidH (DUF202 family)|nr:DUF3185 domain-containing protein [Candidatus Polarisedimenticolia bacterium]
MSTKTMVAMLLIVLGVLAIVYGGFNYRSREAVVDIGNLHVTSERSHPITLPPIAGALAIGAGIILFVFDVRKLVPAGARS